MTHGDTPRFHSLAASIALGLAFTTGAQAQVPGDSPGGSPQYRDATGVMQQGSGAAGTATTSPSTQGVSPTSGVPASSGDGMSSGSSAAPIDNAAGTSNSSGAASSSRMQSPSSSDPSNAARSGSMRSGTSGTTAPDAGAGPANDGAWDPNVAPSPAAGSMRSPRSSLDNEQMPLPSEPTAAGPGGVNGGYDPARTSWIPYTSSGYVGVSGGKPDLTTDCVAGQSCDDPDSAWSVFIGGQFNPYLGLQLGYLQLQDADRNGGDTKVRGVNISLTGALPLGSNFSLNGRVGGTYGWTKTSVGAGVPAPSGNEEGFGLAYGAGASWDFDRNWSVTLDWDRHHLKYAGDEKKDTDVASVGLRYRF